MRNRFGKENWENFAIGLIGLGWISVIVSLIWLSR